MFQAMRKAALAMAFLGGAVLLALIGMTCLSILGRELGALFPASGLGPLAGDFELVEAGMAFVLFSCLPLAQIDRAHAAVDLFAARFPPRLRRGVAALIDMVFAAVLVLIAVQLCAGLVSKRDSGQTSFLLQFPVWWAYAAAVPGAVLAALTGLMLAAWRIRELWHGRDGLPDGAGPAP